jgi:hypothetical protein
MLGMSSAPLSEAILKERALKEGAHGVALTCPEDSRISRRIVILVSFVVDDRWCYDVVTGLGRKVVSFVDDTKRRGLTSQGHHFL